MSKMSGSVLLVGSVPLENAEAVFRACAEKLGTLVDAYPDGETGDRKYWTFYLPTRTYSAHPDLEAVNAPPDGRPHQPGPDASPEEWARSWWTFRLRPGVTALDYPPLGYAEEAERSYAVFRRLRDEGVIPAGARFQVTFPTSGSAVMGFFAVPDDWPAVYAAYQRAVRAEVTAIASFVPHRDLTVQWDTASEVRDILAGDEPLLPWSPRTSLEEKWSRLRRTWTRSPASFPRTPCSATTSASARGAAGRSPTRRTSASACVSPTRRCPGSGRHLDYVHMPVMPDADDAWFAPLEDLEIGDTKPFMGIVLHDGLDAFERRARAVHRYLSDFGIASYCGWGREDPADIPDIPRTSGPARSAWAGCSARAHAEAAPVRRARSRRRRSSFHDARAHAIEGDGGDQKRALGDVLPERVDALQDEPVVEHADDQHSERRSEHRPLAAGERRATEHDRRDHRQLETGRRRRRGRGELRVEDQPRERARQAGDHEEDEDRSFVRIPVSRAATGLAPMAYTVRPKTVYSPLRRILQPVQPQ